ncbi:uncharacterized protein [Pagrus major]|uniref:uncharacterized protein n=1 Tax=Pagrus major TaxID=143350 RepID=UPI003CC87975
MGHYVYRGGWAKVTIRTPKDERVEEHYYARGNSGYPYNQTDDYTSDYTDDYSDRRRRDCHCGWSKVTTYQGLRTHQGKKGCTWKGVRVEERDQHYYPRENGGYPHKQKDPCLDDYTSDYIDYNSNRWLRSCHCGWYKVTTYRGLRIHQGKMGCTPKGIRIPESDQAYWKSWWEMKQRNYQPAVRVEERDQYYIEENEELPYNQNTHNYNSDRRLRSCHCGWSKVTTYQDLRSHQGKMGCTPKRIRIPESEQAYWKSQWEMNQGYYQPAKSTTVRRSGFYMREI